MTREEWAVCTDPHAMLRVVRGPARERKLRLFACALVRCTPWGSAGRAALDIVGCAEDGLDGLATREEARASAHRLAPPLSPEGAGTPGSAASLFLGLDALALDASTAAMVALYDLGHWLGPSRCADLVRCLFSNPCPPAPAKQTRLAAFVTGLLGAFAGSPVKAGLAPGPEPLIVPTPDPSWLTPTVVALARHAYDTRDFSVLPVLADALEDAGCADRDVLTHCRGPDEHAKGCWCLDMLLGKA